MNGLKIEFANAVIPDGKTTEMMAAHDANTIFENHPGVINLSW